MLPVGTGGPLNFDGWLWRSPSATFCSILPLVLQPVEEQGRQEILWWL